jgi:uncharacterized protein involved in exopolysaccharide biosynthesis
MSPEGPRTVTATLVPATDAESRLTQTNADVLFTLLKWHRLILLAAVVMMAAGALGMYLKPPAPAAIARILIKTDRGNLPITGLPATPGGGSLSPDILQTETEFFLSHVVLGPVARALRTNRGETVTSPFPTPRSSRPRSPRPRTRRPSAR